MALLFAEKGITVLLEGNECLQKMVESIVIHAVDQIQIPRRIVSIKSWRQPRKTVLSIIWRSTKVMRSYART